MDPLPAKYSDNLGTENATIHNDGKTLLLTLRKVTFSGDDFDNLSPVDGTTVELLSQFNLHQNCLCECQLLVSFPTTFVENNITSPLCLKALIKLGSPSPSGGLNTETVTLSLLHPAGAIRSSGSSGWFEDELLEIQKRLPTDSYIQNCFGCAYSDYSPFGHGLFGGMLCFKRDKTNYSAVKSKDDLWPLLNRNNVYVQETFACDEFEQRKKNTGYRG